VVLDKCPVQNYLVIFKNNLSFDEHVTAVLKRCSQRAYILKLLRDQGMLQIHLDTVFHALIMSKIRYAVCAWGGFLTQTQKGMISAQWNQYRRMYKYHFVSECFDIDSIVDDMNRKFFKMLFSPAHCLHSLLPPVKSNPYECKVFSCSRRRLRWKRTRGQSVRGRRLQRF